MNNQWAGTTFYYPENPDPSLISGESWRAAQEKADFIISLVQPTMDDEERRISITRFLQKLIRSCFKCQVYPYGSVPLRTYLPHGDIDLTVISETNDVGSLARAVLSMLHEQELNHNSEYPVQDIKFIDAEVKLVKCVVGNVVVDISFNQLGGLCALSFLEQIDRTIGQNHLLKRSIILIKSWCFYESHILGGHFRLISTYALEMLVLHVLNRFNLFFNCPLEVLYRFVDYFGNFDWESYCVSLEGPASRSALPEVIVKKPDNGCTEFLLNEDFLRNCVEVFSVPSSSNDETKPRRPAFQRVLNIIDPLKENNNLGRSVFSGNFQRICHAFRFCARKLNRAFKLPPDEIGHQIEEIFCNTLRKNLPQPCLVFHFDSTFVPKNFKMSSEDKDFLEMLKNRSDDVDFEEFKDLLTLERTENDEDEIMKTFSARRTSLSGEPGYELLNLTGDLDSHLRNLLYAQWSTGVTTGFNVPMRQHLPSDWRGHVPSEWRGHVPSVWTERQPSEWGRHSDEPPKQWRVKSTGSSSLSSSSSSSSSGSSPRQRRLNPNAESWTGSQRGPLVPTAYMARSSPLPVSFGSDPIPRYPGTGTFIPKPSHLYQRTAMSAVPPMYSIPSTTGNITEPETLYSEQQQCATAKIDGITDENEYKTKNKEKFPASK